VQWKETLEGRGISVSPVTRHETLESIYFADPNGYPVEITRRLRDLHELDMEDAALTMRAALEVEREARAAGGSMADIDTVWRRKGRLVNELLAEETR